MQFEMLDIDTVAVPLAVVYIDHAVHGIRVNCIAPGPVYTPHVAAASMPDELQERRRLASPLKLEGTAWDVAHTAVYFASDESRWVTGVVVPVDGGVVLSRASRKQS